MSESVMETNKPATSETAIETHAQYMARKLSEAHEVKEACLRFNRVSLGQTARSNVVEILEPLEVGAGDTTSIDEHVRSALDSSALEDFLGCKGSWAVSTLKYGLHLDLLSVAIVE